MHIDPRVLAKRNLLQEFAEKFPASIKVDSLMAWLTSQETIISEDVALEDPMDKKVDVALKCSFVALTFAIRASAYSSYAIQTDFQSLAELMDEDEDNTGQDGTAN
ncbi:hypothetical protein NDU88_003625 [Pleurodeles waltl]|uniref:Uncharacterized protein n=1 Tax=Pleurodeles waltl TaxID=8319 RepID=A0AAV7RDM4_PLEWA|nr:hypothetical protein NDU88_003625 [Pleurodeles waltl]